jgi:hypothetical protein
VKERHHYYERFLAKIKDDPITSGVVFLQINGIILQVMCTLRTIACRRMRIPMQPMKLAFTPSTFECDAQCLRLLGPPSSKTPLTRSTSLTYSLNSSDAAIKTKFEKHGSNRTAQHMCSSYNFPSMTKTRK